MHLVYTALRIYPFWAVPACVILFHVGRHFRRRKKPLYIPCYSMIVFLGLTTLLWLIFRGDQNSDHWVRAFFES